MTSRLSVLELCAGGGGQAIGLESAGFDCAGAVEIEPLACESLKHNRPGWNVMNLDIREVNGRFFRGLDLLAAGVPCPPFSIAGRQLGRDDERDLFPEALRLIEEVRPGAVLLENVPGFASAKFSCYRRELFTRIEKLGYMTEWQLLNASSYGVPQLRPRFVLVALRPQYFQRFAWPIPTQNVVTVGSALQDLMVANDWPGAVGWASRANGIAPTVVGGSKKHGGPDLGPTRAKKQWKDLGVDGMGIADDAPGPDFPVSADPRLTVRMVARVQSFPDDWHFAGRKTATYRQVGNAFPPKVAEAVGRSIHTAITGAIPKLAEATQRLLEEPRAPRTRRTKFSD